MGKRRRKFKKPRWRVKTVFGKGKGGLDKPLNHGVQGPLDIFSPKAGPLDLNTSEKSVHHNKSSGLIYPEPSPYGYIRPPSKVRAELDFVPTRFPGVPPGKVDAQRRGRQHLKQPIFRSLWKGEHKEIRLWWIPGEPEYILVETDTLVRYRKESIVYSSRELAELMYQLGKIEWSKLERFEPQGKTG